MKVGVITEARMTSSRLPGKHLLQICGQSIFEILVGQLKRSKLSTEVILATTVNEEDDELCEIAEQLGLKIYRGSEDNVLERVIGSAVSHKLDVIVEITADCPLIDPSLIDLAIQTYLDGQFDYVGNTIDRQFADGMDVQVYSTNFLRSTYSPSMKPSYLEHVTSHIISSPHYKKYNIAATPAQFGPDLRITLDTNDDYEIISRVYKTLVDADLEINCENVTRLLK